MVWIPLLLTAIFIALTGTYLWAVQRRDYWKNRNVPFIKSSPLLGHFFEVILMRKSITDRLYELYNHPDAKGHAFVGINIFHRPGLLLRSPELLRRVLIQDFNYFSNKFATTSPSVDSVGYHNLFLVKNPMWREIRNKMSPIFSAGKIKQMFTIVDKVACDLNTYLMRQQEKLSTDQTLFSIDMREISALYGIDALASVAYGIDANSLTELSGEFTKGVLNILHFTRRRSFEFSSVFLLPGLTKLLRSKFFADTNDFLRRAITEVMENRENSGTVRHDLIDVLIHMKNDPAAKFSPDVLLGQAAVFILAGHESTASTVSNTLFYLAKNPHVQEKLRHEIKTVLEPENGTPTYETVMLGMPYFDMVINETLRFFPVLPVHDRICTLPKGMKDGYSLEPFSSLKLMDGTPVFVPPHAIHMDPEYFENPEKFDPERFSPANKDKIKPYSFLPFGLGPHNCIGERLGLLQVKCALLHILKNFYVATCDQTPETIKFNAKSIIMIAEAPMILRFEQNKLFQA